MKVKTADMTKYRREYMRQYRKDNPEKIARLQRRNYEKNIDKRRADSNAAYHRTRWPSHLRRKYGLTPEQFAQMVHDQDAKCALCGTDEPGGRGKRFHIDHCHKSGKVRQLLCNACNHMLGCARDRPEVLRAAAVYLEHHAAHVLTPDEKSS